MIKVSKTHALLVGSGFLLGTLGVRALKSKFVKNLAVQGVAAGMRAKSGYEDIVEQAKAQVDDIVAEAEYLNAEAAGTDAACDCGCHDVAETVAPAAE